MRYIFHVFLLLQPGLLIGKTEPKDGKVFVELQVYRDDLQKIEKLELQNSTGQVKAISNKIIALKDYEKTLAIGAYGLGPSDLNSVNRIWRKVVDETIGGLFLTKDPEIEIPIMLANVETSTETAKEALNLKRLLEEKIYSSKKARDEMNNRLLLRAGRVRAAIMAVLIEQNEYSVWEISKTRLKDILREIQIVPYRLLATFAEKFFEFKAMAAKGPMGHAAIAGQLCLLLFVLFLPIALLRAFRLFSKFLEDLRYQLIRSGKDNFRRKVSLSAWIGKINPFLPWFFAYLAIPISRVLLSGTLLAPIMIVLPYLQIYVLYRAFLIFFSALLGKVLLSKNLDQIRTQQIEVEKTAARLSILFFLEWAFLHATEDAVRQALVYNIVFDAIICLNIALIAKEARSWKRELLTLSEQWLWPKPYAFLVQLKNPIIEFLVYPLLFLGNLFFLLLKWVYQYIGQYDFGKKISSEIFKKRLEGATSEKQTNTTEQDDAYKALFLNPDTHLEKNECLTLSRSPLETCSSIIESWSKESAFDDLILVHAYYGMGKSTFLEVLEENIQNSIAVKKISLDKKVTTKKDLFSELSKAFSAEIQTTADLEKIDKTMPKTLLIIDDIQQLYLNTTEGLGAYRSLIDLTSLQLDNLFWVFSCDTRSLLHLNGLFGLDHFNGHKIELSTWRDSEIQDLILQRHKKSGYKLRFDRVISAVHRGDILESSSGLEVQFFRLLWGQSRGNPLTAQELWLTATSKEWGNTTKVSVPDFIDPNLLAELRDETMMIYAAIVKHEKLKLSEILKVCSMSKSLVRQALKFGEDCFCLKRDEGGRWRIHPRAQYSVYAQLIGRNLIYG